MSRSISGLCLSSATRASSPATATDDGVSLPSGGGSGSGSGAGAADVGGSGSGRLVEMLDSKVCKDMIQQMSSLLKTTCVTVVGLWLLAGDLWLTGCGLVAACCCLLACLFTCTIFLI